MDYFTLLMELQRNNEAAVNVRGAAELMLSELEARTRRDRDWAKMLGHMIGLARGMMTSCTETSS
jgi:hypothetical protein